MKYLNRNVMQFFLIIIGFILVFLGGYWLIKSFRVKQIYYNDLKEETIKVNLQGNKKYIISFVGGFFNKDEGMKVNTINYSSNKIIETNKYRLKYQFVLEGDKGFDYYHFKTNEAGAYGVQIENPERLRLVKSNLKLKRVVLPKNDIHKKILIKEKFSSKKKLISIIILVLGANALIFGLFYDFF